jgi:hypothetical protein
MRLLATHLRRRTGATLGVACLALLLCAQAQAGGSPRRAASRRPAATRPANPAAPAVAVAPAVPAGAAGMVIVRDPDTGALVAPTAEQAQTLTAAERTGLSRSTEGLSEVRYADGHAKVDLQGRFMEYSVVQLDRAGCPHFLCVNDEAVLRALLARLAPASTPALEER